KDAAIVAYGVMVHKALEAAELLARQGIDCGVLNVSAPKALDEEKIRQAAATGLVLAAEDHNQASGLGAMLGAYLMEHNLSCAYVRMGVTAYGISAPAAKQYAVQHLQAEDLANAVAKARLGGQP
ncbi:MAG: transketolase C-terminal domain-containing protein, partial [Candidatus Limiplasma sp.]|nr:transketolase C-terminal domain-containing protein [Candidatus Limiplasma sp.]